MSKVIETTPIGIAQHAYLNTPSTKFNPNGDYFVVLKLNREESNNFISKIETHLEDFCHNNNIKASRAQTSAYQKLINEEGEETGEYTFKFSMKAKIEPKEREPFTQRPILFDERGKPTNTIIWPHSKVQVAYTFNPWVTPIGYGISLRLRAVHIKELGQTIAQGDPNNPSTYGFEIDANVESDASTF